MNTTDHLQVENRSGCLWITLRRPDKANALTVQMTIGVMAALAKAAADPSVRAIAVTGAGEKVYCAGVDVREQPADGDVSAHRERRSAALFELLNALLDSPRPVVAVLNGVASGGGAMLALVCDARVAADGAEISLPEINLGLPTFAGAAIATHLGGTALAADLVQTGRRMPATEALARGLLASVVSRQDLEAEGTRVAALLAHKDPAAFAANKRWLNRGMKAALADARAESVRHRAARDGS
jgi:enoyl-CoA hydratase/carnithine racemase